jgi:hypothetical protein
MLGEPVICVELDDTQITAMVEQALGIYGTYKPVEKFGSVAVLASQQKYDLTQAEIGRGIIELFRPDLLRAAISLDQFDVFKYHTHLPNLDPGDYYAERVWWKEVRRSAGSDDDWEFILDPTTGDGTLYLSPIPSEAYTCTFIYVVDPTLTEVPLSDDDWIKDYVLAMAMQVLGRMRRKFGSVQGAEASIDLDGAELVSEGTELRTQMEEYLTGRGQIVAPIRG